MKKYIEFSLYRESKHINPKTSIIKDRDSKGYLKSCPIMSVSLVMLVH